jgi:lipase ATG15
MVAWAHAAAAARNGALNASASASRWIAPKSQDDVEFGFGSTMVVDGWEDVEVDAPDVSDRQTLLTLAKMASNAYTTPETDGWYPLPGNNNSSPIGWEPDTDGLRGHIFADDTNTTVVIAIKGTSAGVLGSGGPTAKNDKFNVSLQGRWLGTQG